MADQVVNELKGMGFEAAASYTSVADRDGAEAIFKTATDAFGRVDIVVNNAGILRDRTLLKMSDDEFDLVMKVHARGTYLCTQIAGHYFKQAGHGGAIINTTSYSGLVGNFGQSNYGCAKAGIAGFTRTIAQEFGRMGVTVNCIAPMAKTRMTENIAAVPEDVTPEMISPFVVYLGSELAQDVTGRIFGTHGPQIFEYRMMMTDGVTKDDGLWTASEIADAMEEIGQLPRKSPSAGRFWRSEPGRKGRRAVRRYAEGLPGRQGRGVEHRTSFCRGGYRDLHPEYCGRLSHLHRRRCRNPELHPENRLFRDDPWDGTGQGEAGAGIYGGQTQSRQHG